MKYIIAIVAVISLGGFGLFTYLNQGGMGGDGTINQLNQWRSDGGRITQNVAGTILKLTGYESAGDCLVTDASGVVSTSACGGGGSSKWTDGGSIIYPTTGESIEVSSIAATGTATSTFTRLAVSTALNLFGTVGSALSDFCVAITGGAGLCDGNDATGGGGSGSNWDIVSGGLETATTTDFARAAYFVGTSTTATSTFINAGVTTLSALTSAGLDIDSNNGTHVLNLGQGGGSSATFAGGVNIDGQTRLATSLTGILRANAGVVTTNATGTLTENATGLEFSATRDVLGGSAVLSLTSGFTIPTTTDTANWNTFYNTPSTRITAGTNLSWSSNTLNAATQISTSSTAGNLAFWTGTSALGNVATGTLTETVSGLEFSATRALVGGASVLSLSSGFSIPSTTDFIGWTLASTSRHSAVTLSGALDYITLVGQDIVRGAIDLATDITGILADDNGGTGQSTYATGDMLYASGVNTLAKRTIGSTGNVLSVVGGVPSWVATSTLGLGGSGGSSNWTDAGTYLTPLTATDGLLITGSSTFADLKITNSTTTGNLNIKSNRFSEHGLGFLDLQRAGSDYTLMRIRGPRGDSNEATLSLVNDLSTTDAGVDEEFVDIYNERYEDSLQWGLRQAYSGTGVAKPFAIGHWQTTGGKDAGNKLIILPSGTVAVARATSTIPQTTAFYVASSTATNLLQLDATPGTTRFFVTSAGAMTVAATSTLASTTITGRVTLNSLADGCLYTSANILLSTGSACGAGGGGGGALSTTTDTIGNGGSQLVSYIEGDVMFGGNSSTTAEFQFDDDGGQLIIASSSQNATATIESNNTAQAVRIGDDIGSGLEMFFGTVGDAMIRGYGAVTKAVFGIGVRFMAQVYDSTGAAGSNGQVLLSTGTSTLWTSTSSLGISGGSGGSGDVVGPASATDNAIARYDATTGKLIQNSGVTIDDTNNIIGVGDMTAANLTATNELTVTTISPYTTTATTTFMGGLATRMRGFSLNQGLEYVFSTVGDAIINGFGGVTELIVNLAESLFQGNVRITGHLHVATTTYYGATTTDQLVVAGFTNSGEWIQEFCTTPTAEVTQVAADTLRGCGRYAYLEDTNGVIDFTAPTTGTSSYFRIRAGASGTTVAAGDGMGIGWASGIDFGDIQRHQPAMEWTMRQDTMANASSSTIIAGITDKISVTADFATEPGQGFYVIATSTTPNYRFACNPSTGGTTYIDTGIASSTTATASANPFTHFRLEVGGTSNTAVTAILKARTVSNQDFTQVGACQLNLSASTQLVAPTVALGKSTTGSSPELHTHFLKFWYKQPVF